MLGLAVYSVCGATLCYLWGRGFQRKADDFNSITRVKDLGRLDDLLKEKARNLLVVVSGRVGSAAPFDSKDIGASSVVLEQSGEVNYVANKLEESGVMINKSLSILFQLKETPWYLEDATGQVNIVGIKEAVGFEDTLRKYESDYPRSLFEIIDVVFGYGDGVKVPDHGVEGRTLNTGTFLTFVAEASRDEAGNIVIQKPEKGSFLVFNGEGSFDKMVGNFKADSEFYLMLSKIFGSVAVAVAVIYGVGYIRKNVLPFLRKKMNSRKRSEEAKSDSEEE